MRQFVEGRGILAAAARWREQIEQLKIFNKKICSQFGEKGADILPVVVSEYNNDVHKTTKKSLKGDSVWQKGI